MEGGQKVEQFSIRRKAQRVTRFVIVQFIAILGWILVQLFFSISSIGRTVPFGIVLVIEAIWWMGLLLIMLLLFLNEWNRFVQAAVDLEDANNRLRRRANAMLEHVRDAAMADEGRGQNGQRADNEVREGQESMQAESGGSEKGEDEGSVEEV